jgi:hypothetical protein
MTLKTLFISSFILFGLTASGQVILDCDSLKIKIQHDKDSLPKFDLFMKDRFYGVSFNSVYDKNYSFGIGYYLYADMFSKYRRIPSPSYETNINYHLDGYLYHSLTIKIPFLIAPSLSFCSYTDFSNTSFFVRPGIGIDAWVANINYSPNWLVADNLGIATKHNFSAYFRLGIIKNVWKDSRINLSQWDKHKLKRK